MMVGLVRHAARTLRGHAGTGLRLAARHSARWVAGRVAPRRGTGAALVVALLGSTVAYGASLGGQAGTWGDAAAAGLGYGVVDLRLDGAVETREREVGAAVGLGGGRRSLVSIDVDAARAALVALPWIVSATVAKEYPGTLDVAVVEREAVARWMLGARTFLVDAGGAMIVESDGRPLPLIVGEGADAHVADALALRVAVPEVTGAIKAMVRVGARRWDVVTHRNVTVMLPAEAPEAALDRLAALHEAQGLLDKDVAAIDLRVPDRLVVRLTPEAAARRAAALTEAGKARKIDRKARQVSL